MIKEIKIQHCTKCGSTNIVKNGTTQKGKQKFHCKDCGAYATIEPSERYSEGQQELILRVYQERASLRGIERVFGVARQTVAAWIKKSPGAAPLERLPGGGGAR